MLSLPSGCHSSAYGPFVMERMFRIAILDASRYRRETVLFSETATIKIMGCRVHSSLSARDVTGLHTQVVLSLAVFAVDPVRKCEGRKFSLPLRSDSQLSFTGPFHYLTVHLRPGSCAATKRPVGIPKGACLAARDAILTCPLFLVDGN